jgi:hypothetical protein
MTDTPKQTITWTVILTLKHLYDRYTKTNNYMNSHIDIETFIWQIRQSKQLHDIETLIAILTITLTSTMPLNLLYDSYSKLTLKQIYMYMYESCSKMNSDSNSYTIIVMLYPQQNKQLHEQSYWHWNTYMTDTTK